MGEKDSVRRMEDKEEEEEGGEKKAEMIEKTAGRRQ